MKTQLLILDDFGLNQMTSRGRADLLELLDDRVGASSTIVLGQMPVKEWHSFINDPALADAILDRLVHSSHKIALKGESMRKLKAESGQLAGTAGQRLENDGQLPGGAGQFIWCRWSCWLAIGGQFE